MFRRSSLFLLLYACDSYIVEAKSTFHASDISQHSAILSKRFQIQNKHGKIASFHPYSHMKMLSTTFSTRRLNSSTTTHCRIRQEREKRCCQFVVSCEWKKSRHRLIQNFKNTNNRSAQSTFLTYTQTVSVAEQLSAHVHSQLCWHPKTQPHQRSELRRLITFPNQDENFSRWEEFVRLRPNVFGSPHTHTLKAPRQCKVI